MQTLDLTCFTKLLHDTHLYPFRPGLKLHLLLRYVHMFQ